MWALFTEGTRKFSGWYVTLEKPHVRDTNTVYTSDNVLDLVVQPDRTTRRKDEDELALAVAQGVFQASTAATIEQDAAAVEEVIADWGPPFCDGWEHFQPDPAWPDPGGFVP